MDEPMITDDERRDIVERLKSEKIPNLLGLYSAILGEEEKNNTYKLYQKLIKLIEPQTCKLNDYIDYINDAIDINLCNAMLQRHLKEIARRYDVYENDIINWVNDNGGIENVKQYVRVAKNVKRFVNKMYEE